MSANIEYSRRERTLALLGGERSIGLSANELDNPARLIQMIRDGLPVASAHDAHRRIKKQIEAAVEASLRSGAASGPGHSAGRRRVRRPRTRHALAQHA